MSKPPQKVFDLARHFRNMRNKTTKFVQRRILSASRAMLLVGGDTNPDFRKKLVDKCQRSWKIAGLSQTSYQCDLHIPFTKFDKDTLQNVENQLFGFHKLYESVVLLPEKYDWKTDFRNENFLQEFYTDRPNKVELALTAYKFASRFLTNSGVVLLSSAQKPFFEEKNLSPSEQCLQDQVCNINLHLGERDHIDIDANVLCVLSEQADIDERGKDQEQVLELYRNWLEGRGMPFPGSFVKLARKDKLIYPQFY